MNRYQEIEFRGRGNLKYDARTTGEDPILSQRNFLIFIVIAEFEIRARLFIVSLMLVTASTLGFLIAALGSSACIRQF